MKNNYSEDVSPLVSICLPTYNGAQYLLETLASINNQSYKNIELIISDDNSNDDTLRILEEFKSKLFFPCIIYKHASSGIAENWNNTLKNANGKYIKFVFQDDLLLPTCIEKMVEVLESDSDIGLITSKRMIITAENNRFTQGFISNFKDLQRNLPLLNKSLNILEGKEILKGNYFIKKPINIIGEPSAVMFKQAMLSEIGYFNKTMFQLVDYEYWVRMFKKYKIAFLKEELVQFRLHNSQASFVNNKRQKNDNDLFYKVLYNKYFYFLHNNFKWVLIKRFHWSFKMYRFIKSVLQNKY